MIKVLESWISDKIAAGEVIERPLSIVKELVENSIDANSSSIIIDIKNGGKSYIRVTDNGIGIPQDQIETAFLRHATSKIANIQDLDNINTLGFRGEALASISAVSKLTIVSRTVDSLSGIKMLLHGGQLVSKTTVGANKGTTIIVEDVFYNTPARRKFMRSDAREASAIIELIQSYAIYYSNIKFMLINNGKTILNTNGDNDCPNVISTVFGSPDFRNLIHIDESNIKGYISNPGVTRTNRKAQLFYVNGRLVDSKVIEEGIIKGYGDRLFSGYPIAILFININPSLIDVNIHPGKREVKFLNSLDIIKDISNAISTALLSKASIPESVHLDRANASTHSKQNAVSQALPQLSIQDYLVSLDNLDNTETEYVREEDTNYNASLGECMDFDTLQIAGYVFNSYIICQSQDNNIYIIDQHAAHERIFYEKLMSSYNSNSHNPQDIFTPFTIETSIEVYNGTRKWMDCLHQMGYIIEDFGANTFVVKAIPHFMNMTEAHDYASAFIDGLGDYDGTSAIEEKLIINSCKSAVKAGDKLNHDEQQELIYQLSSCKNPYSCPHGRPTIIKITKYEIEKGFKRK